MMKLQGIILRALDELGGRAKPTVLAQKAWEIMGGAEMASIQSIKFEIWRMVDYRELTWTPERDIRRL